MKRLAAIIVFLLMLIAPGSASAYFPNAMRVLVTGFEPFDKYPVNPTKQLVEYINKQTNLKAEGFIVNGVVLPVEYDASWLVLKKAIDEFHPDIVLSFGFAPGSRQIRLEAVARNFDGGTPDNKKVSHKGKIIDSGPVEYQSGLPFKELRSVLSDKGIAVQISTDAGDYVCNNLYYNLMNYASTELDIRVGFIHVPDRPIDSEKGLYAVFKTIVDILKERSVKVGVFEFEPLKNKPSNNIQRVREIVESTKDRNIGMYLFPEMAVTGLTFLYPKDLLTKNIAIADGSAIESLKKIAVDYKIYLGIGLPEKTNDNLYNSYFVIGPTGNIELKYRKIHLFGTDTSWADPGDLGYPSLLTPFGRFGILICHDVTYDESFYRYLADRVDFLIIGTNWIGKNKIHKYFRNDSLEYMTFFIPDRKGREDEILFPGNTSVFKGDAVIAPRKINDRYTGVVYMYMRGL